MDVDELYDSVASGGVDLALGLDYPDVPIPREPALRVMRLYQERFSLAVPAEAMDGRSCTPRRHAREDERLASAPKGV